MAAPSPSGARACGPNVSYVTQQERPLSASESSDSSHGTRDSDEDFVPSRLALPPSLDVARSRRSTAMTPLPATRVCASPNPLRDSWAALAELAPCISPGGTPQSFTLSAGTGTPPPTTDGGGGWPSDIFDQTPEPVPAIRESLSDILQARRTSSFSPLVGGLSPLSTSAANARAPPAEARSPNVPSLDDQVRRLTRRVRELECYQARTPNPSPRCRAPLHTVTELSQEQASANLGHVVLPLHAGVGTEAQC